MKSSLVFLSLFSLVMQLSALTIDPIYQSHMVLQQGKPVPVSGTATGKGDVVVSFGEQKVKAKKKGKTWQAVLAPMTASAEGKTLTVTQGEDTATLDDVVVGEVWLASGQSNMEWQLAQARDKDALNQEQIDNLRYYHAVPQVHTRPGVYAEEFQAKLREGDMYRGTWSVSNKETCRPMSAVGWYFGRKLQGQLGVPVGIIHVSLGGSEMVAWIPPAVLRQKHKESVKPRWAESKYVMGWARRRSLENMGGDATGLHPYKPGYLYETGIAPWAGFPLAGVIWYQGETDAESPDMKQHERVLTDLIESWRAVFKEPQLPFLMVQLPRIKDEGKNSTRLMWPEYRQVQQNVADAMPGVYCVNTIDLGTTSADVHPPRKLEVGERLADTAASQVYGKAEVPYIGPVVKEVKPQGEALCLSFDQDRKSVV